MTVMTPASVANAPHAPSPQGSRDTEANLKKTTGAGAGGGGLGPHDHPAMMSHHYNVTYVIRDFEKVVGVEILS